MFVECCESRFGKTDGRPLDCDTSRLHWVLEAGRQDVETKTIATVPRPKLGICTIYSEILTPRRLAGVVVHISGMLNEGTILHLISLVAWIDQRR